MVWKNLVLYSYLLLDKMARCCRSFPVAFSPHRICNQWRDLFRKHFLFYLPDISGIFSGWSLIVCLSVYSKNSSPFVVWRICTSPQHMSLGSLQPRRPKKTVFLNQTVFSRASGVDFPNNPLSYSSFFVAFCEGNWSVWFIAFAFLLEISLFWF